jgi:hypothetical protein
MLSEEEKHELAKSDPIEYHFSLGMWIRNNWIYTGERGNLESLLKDLGEPEFLMGDMASSAILEAYQRYLKGEKS